jgi:hypothetical protein
MVHESVPLAAPAYLELSIEVYFVWADSDFPLAGHVGRARLAMAHRGLRLGASCGGGRGRRLARLRVWRGSRLCHSSGHAEPH